MIYSKEINEFVSVVDSVFDDLRIPQLLNNTDFIIDEMSTSYWFKVNLNPDRKNNIPLSLTFTETSLEIRLDRIAEAIDWTKNDLIKAVDKIKEILKNLFTSYILVEYYGTSDTRISLFGDTGTGTNKLRYSEGFSFNNKKEQRLYFPIYSYK
jgi:hypothetical protein